jgi:aminoglycoside/choline kinase family phosphotransferase
MDLSQEIKDDFLNTYLDVRRTAPDRELFCSRLKVAAVLRLMQAFGAYAKLSVVNGRSEYREFLLPAVERLRLVLKEKEMAGYPLIGELVDLFAQILGSEK